MAIHRRIGARAYRLQRDPRALIQSQRSCTGVSDCARVVAAARYTGAAFFADEAIGPLHALGIVLISGGIIAIALERSHVSLTGLLAALATGVTIAVYTVIDGIGVRASGGQALAYTAWMYLFYWLMPLLFVAVRGLPALLESVRAVPTAIVSSLVGGLVSIGAYGIVIWALQSGAMGAVSALREASVVFAVLIGRVFLREGVSGKRWLA